ncbi:MULTISPECIES: hypothetical protein [unclassified Micromonospora]|uniref:hypothetical protein n=1 Tax=unclassified Micromonospora TaxID=2617518 RepID=UPI001FB76293|nr:MULTISPECIES: hypothetical protein [unclassified Micromonospora]
MRGPVDHLDWVTGADLTFLEHPQVGPGQRPLGEAPDDNPSLGTGAYALDQSWHIAFLFVSAVVIAL